MEELREPTFLLLCALADGPKYGYAIRQDVESASGGTVLMRTGTLYAALDRLSGDGMIARFADEVVDGRPRHYYRLTDAGVDTLRAAAERRAAQARLAHHRLRVAASAPVTA